MIRFLFRLLVTGIILRSLLLSMLALLIVASTAHAAHYPPAGSEIASLQETYNLVNDCDTIKATTREFNESLLLDRPISVIVQGGYTDTTYTTTGGFTTLNGTLVVANGMLQVSNVAVSSGITDTTDTIAPTTPGTPTVSGITSTGLTLNWTASTAAVGVTGYRVERCQGASCTTFTQVGTPTSNSYTDSGLTESTQIVGGTPTSLPLVQRSDITYLGSFAVPQQDANGAALTYGGYALGHNPITNSLFIGCHDWYDLVAEVSIPSFNGTANILQPCTDIYEGNPIE